MSPLLLGVVLSASAADSGMEISIARADQAPATVAVSLPMDATLMFDGQPTSSTSTYRLFTTPPLEKCKTFRYSVRAEIVRAGTTLTILQKISVQAGRTTFVSFDLPTDVHCISFMPGASGAGRQTRSYYLGPTSAVPAAPVGAGPRELSGPPVSGGFRPTLWGSDPSDPFYHSGQ
jgi:uncharacterized protein (TIGR03000 family)